MFRVSRGQITTLARSLQYRSSLTTHANLSSRRNFIVFPFFIPSSITPTPKPPKRLDQSALDRLETLVHYPTFDDSGEGYTGLYYKKKQDEMVEIKKELSSFHKQYDDYYRYHYGEDGKKWHWSEYLAISGLIGAVIGMGLGFREAFGLRKSKSRHNIYSQIDIVVFPAMGMAVGFIGGAVPPLGLWWLYVYCQKVD